MNHRTSRFSMLSVGIMAAVFAVPQLLFFCLAPDVPCKMTVYGFMTGYTLFHLLWSLFLWERKGTRIAVAPVHLSTAFVVTELAGCAILLAVKATISAAVYSLIILGLIHFLAEAILYSTLE